jgi:1-acyl-sn-glycerol-3-phosphate acyltransferase
MALARGSRLGDYEVLGLLGAGGMGEVYEARDTRLDRRVALKVLPNDFAADPERLSRFRREAKTVRKLLSWIPRATGPSCPCRSAAANAQARTPGPVRRKRAVRISASLTLTHNPPVLRYKVIAAPLSLLVWASYVAIVILWTPLVFFYRLATFRSDPNRERLGRFFRKSAVLAGDINPFWTLRIVDDLHPDPRRPHVFVANHRSNADAFLIVRLPWEMKLLAKKSIMSIPLLGWQMRMAGDVPIVRGDKESRRHAMEEMRRRLDRGASVFLFPEGTRSEDGTLGAFREGAFRLAIEAGVDVVPLAISGTEEALPKHSIIFHPTAATLTVLPAISTKGLTDADASHLAQEVRMAISRALPPRPI